MLRHRLCDILRVLVPVSHRVGTGVIAFEILEPKEQV